LSALSRRDGRAGAADRLRLRVPVLYRLMFSVELSSPDVGRPPIEKEAAARVRAIIDDVLAEGGRSGALPANMAEPRKRAAASLAIWSALHGLTMLAIDDFVGPVADIETLVEPILGALLDGIALHLPALPAHIWIVPRLNK